MSQEYVMSEADQTKRKELQGLIAEEMKHGISGASQEEIDFTSYKCSLIALNAVKEGIKENQIHPAIG